MMTKSKRTIRRPINSLLDVQRIDVFRVYRAIQRNRKERLGLPVQTREEFLAERGINLNYLYDRRDLGGRLNLNSPLDVQIKEETGAFLRRAIISCETAEEARQRRYEWNRPERNERERRRRRRKKHMARAAEAALEDLDDRASAIFSALASGEWTTIQQLADIVQKAKCRAFGGLTGKVLTDTIRREIGKTSLTGKLQQRKRGASHQSNATYTILEVRLAP